MRVCHTSRERPVRVVNCPTHTPYDGSAKPFTIGLKPLDLAEWIELDAHFEAYLAEKRRLYAAIPEKVFVAEDGNGGGAAGGARPHCRTSPNAFPRTAADTSPGP